MNEGFKTYEEVEKSQRFWINGMIESLGFTEGMRKVLEDRDRFKRKSEEAEKAINQVNDYDDALNKRDGKSVKSSRLLFSADIKGFFGTYQRSVEIELTETVIESLIDMFTGKAQHFKNCYTAIDNILNEMGGN